MKTIAIIIILATHISCNFDQSNSIRILTDANTDSLRLKSAEINNVALEMFNRNMSLDKADSVDKIIALYEEAITIYPKNDVANANLIQTLTQAKRYPEALKAGKRMFANVGTHESCAGIGYIYDKMGYPDSADMYYKEALEIVDREIKNEEDLKHIKNDKLNRLAYLKILGKESRYNKEYRNFVKTYGKDDDVTKYIDKCIKNMTREDFKNSK